MTAKRKTWKQRIGKRLLAHVKETTKRGTLREAKLNIAGQQDAYGGIICEDCAKIAKKLGLK